MRRFQIRLVSLPALAFLVLAANPIAQDKSTALLNTLEVQELVKRAEPADNARLAAHFMALAERDDDEAKRHTSMSQSFVGNPSRSLGTGMSAHCKRLANFDTQSATALRAMAAYHQKLAAGVAATPPTAGGRYEGGAGTAAPTDQELNAWAAKASTPSEHHSLEEYFQTLAKRYSADVNEHLAMGNTYRGTRIAEAAVHCDRLVKLSRQSAYEATAAAAMHKQLARMATQD